jgi:acyl carrier protein
VGCAKNPQAFEILDYCPARAVPRGGALAVTGCTLRADEGSLRPSLTPLPDHTMSEQSPAERELAQLLVESLNLEDVAPEQIDPQAALFNDGLGLDSIDALELALAITKRYGFQLRSDSDENRRIFASLRALSSHIEQHRAG